MTKSIIRQLTDKDILDYIRNLNKRPDVLNRILKNHHKDIYDELVLRTQFLDNGYFKDKPVPILARLYCLEHGLKSSPVCQSPKCSNPVEWRNGTHTFAPHCCRQCYLDDPNSHHKEEETKERKYGNKYYYNKEKAVETSRKHFGEGNYNNRLKFKQTCQAKFNGNAPACSRQVVEKMQATKEERYGDPGFNNHEQAANTVKDKYGVSNVSQIDGVQEKVKDTNMRLYGKTHFNKTDEYKAMYPEIRRKCAKRWVLLWNDDKSHIKFRKGDEPDDIEGWQHRLEFDSGFEVDVFVFCKLNHDMDCDYQPKISFPYEYKGKHHTYHPDFIINGKVVEVKGDNFFRINKESGKEEMYCPWRRPEWSDDYYVWRCGLEEAKHQCMLTNEVKILRKKDVENLTVEMFN